MIYDAVNQSVLAEIPRDARRILDIGCGSGALGASLKQRQQCAVFGITLSEEEAERARCVLDGVDVGNLDTFDLATQRDPYDVIVCSHVLEHLKNPLGLLQALQTVAERHTRLVVALPNVLHWKQRLAFVRGEFRYTDGGLMDQTHLRFFDWTTARLLVENAGWKLEKRLAQGHFPLAWRLPRIGRSIDHLANRFLPGLTGEQFILIGKVEV